MILSDYNYYILTNACLYYHVFILARFITKRRMMDWLRMHVHPIDPPVRRTRARARVCVCVCVCVCDFTH
jgi:hypothetical protein